MSRIGALLFIRLIDLRVFARPAFTFCLFYGLHFLGQLASFWHIFLLETIRIRHLASCEEDLMLPIAIKLVNKILNLEADSGLDMRVCALFDHHL